MKKYNLSKDIHYMRHALAVARAGVGRMGSIRPSVGCVLVKDDVVLAAARTGDGGRPHAEAAALAKAGGAPKGATAYVTLEPCAHQGKTPPCARALVEAGIARCVIGCLDPFAAVNGKGVEILKAAGIAVDVGVLEEACEASHAGFFLAVTENRPFVTLKIATSVDQKIAAGKGARTQITGEMAARYTHLLRSQHDAILVGANTARIDRPSLTTRIEGYQHDIKRYVLGACDVDGLHGIAGVDTRDIGAVLAHLVDQGVTRLLVEGGAQTHTSFLKSGFIDQFIWMKAPHNIGGQGVSALVGHSLGDLEADFGLRQQKTKALGEDLLAIYGRKD